MNVTISLNLPPLPENDVWFANAQAFNNYFSNVAADVKYTPAAVTIYTPIPFDTSLNPAIFNIDGTSYVIATKPQLDSLISRVDGLSQSFEDFMTQLKDAGYLSPTYPYSPVAYDTGLEPITFNVEGVAYVAITVDMLNSLKDRVDSISASYIDLRKQLFNVGWISNA